MTSDSWVKRSTPVRSASVTTPTGRWSASTTTPALWARLGSRASASATVWAGERTIGVSSTRWRVLTQEITSVTTSIGMSWGITTMPPRRATVSAMRRPAIAVMLATTSGMVVPVPSGEARSTPWREPTAERLGTMNTSSYVRSYGGLMSLRKRTC